MTSHAEIVLPENLTIAGLQALHDEMEALIDQKDCEFISVKGADVSRVDTAGMQLLLAFFKATKERNLPLKWDGHSDKIIEAAELLGLDLGLAAA